MTSSMIRAIRGATTTEIDTPEAIHDAVQELLRAMLETNNIVIDSVVNVFFTSTSDLVSAFPATAARSVGFADVPLMCASEIAVPGSLPRCLRIMMVVSTERDRSEIRHVYLRQAVSLRDDLAK